MEDNVYIRLLFYKYLSGEHNTDELKILCDHFGIKEHEDQLERLILEHLDSDTYYADLSEMKEAKSIVEDRWKNIAALTDDQKEVRTIRRYRISIAVALLISIGFAAMYFIKTRQQPGSQQLTSIYGADVLPGSTKATLTLSDSREIQLDTTSNGINIGATEISYTNGQVISSTEKVTSATLNVPNGGIYRLTLPDGSKVVLNSGSSITYPVRFEDSVRLVALRGEAYFEVAPSKTQPFKVQSTDQILTVLGTHFNIQSYSGEQTETTLLEGKVALESNLSAAKAILNPGQQGRLDNNKFQTKKVNADESIAWSRNLFVFNNIPLSQIFRNLERWYDVEIVYPQRIGNERYLMEIPKDRKLSEILGSISDLIDINFKIEGRRVTAIVK
ncbi:MAG: hypothetical protein BGO31_20750 [Bacteroidetes bacterium 43-16]|uniref:FecR family protein n=1 Tax=uncultured Dysgonomonas sp. TaxID=206096 RepID=UPI000929E034|nr:FecR family protein [uncultured Dysgonomonas sp.]OJV55361.1 MAG: hypothetical protein BGO31_20750 [Bacteroidetes bacterium 43-16]